ncbi:peptidyl-prolyl cis-trans isomerase [Cytobacillus sp. FJAT-54145]|uniref:peptidylprolyl isomerase n=1 Tax=Cytobacillus spartinae TaxID=3299023 RepID=A0ABW6KMJ3_9BACI
MEKKQLWVIIAGLILLNCLTVAFFLTNQGQLATGNEEVVATVGKDTITREDWLNEIETRYGQDVLQDIIDGIVIKSMAEKYNIDISDKEIEQELLMVKTMYGSYGDDSANEEEWKEQIKNNLLLEELLTKDVVVSEEEMKAYYEQNSSYYHIPTSYHLSHIVVKTEEEAEQTLKELNQGSNFATLAMERSIDEFSANQGGDLGYITEEADHFSRNYLKVVEQLKPGKWSDAILTEDGYSIVMLHERINGKEFPYNEVKNQVRRQIALEQMDVAVSASAFWDELDVDWFYGKKSAE